MNKLNKARRYLLAGALVAGILGSSVPVAKAQDLRAIQSQIDSLQTTIKALQKQVEEAKAQAAAAQTTAANAEGSDLDLKVKWKGAPELSSKDGKFKFKVRGRINADYNGIDQDTAITGDPDVSATELRRARLGVEGVLFSDWKYILEVDFANDTTAIKDAYVQYTGWPVYITVGNFKTPNTLDNLTSANYITFMERAGVHRCLHARSGDRRRPVPSRPHWTASAGIFGEGPGAAPLFSGFTGDENVTFASRITAAPINREAQRRQPGAPSRCQRADARCGQRSASAAIPRARRGSASRQFFRQHRPGRRWRYVLGTRVRRGMGTIGHAGRVRPN